LANRLDKTVFVKADARAKYERVVEVVDNLRAAGVDQLGLLTDEVKDNRPNPTTPAAGAAPAGQ
jgi:biopolymer transport protein ExbD/biopolymer transport protein TolR